MVTRQGKSKKKYEFKSAYVSVQTAELGWYGRQGGRTVTVTFRDGRDRKVGELTVSAARIRWWGARHRRPITVSSRHLDDLFVCWLSGEQ